MDAFPLQTSDGSLQTRDGKGIGTTIDDKIVWQNRQQSGEVRVQNGNVPTLCRNIGTGGNNVPMVGIRRLTPTECARLQGFDDDWNDFLSDSARYKQYGNAVTVPVAEWIGNRIVKLEDVT